MVDSIGKTIRLSRCEAELLVDLLLHEDNMLAVELDLELRKMFGMGTKEQQLAEE